MYMSLDSDVDVDGGRGHEPRQPRPKNILFDRNQRYIGQTPFLYLLLYLFFIC
jgi:hypothetical protein